MAEVHRALATEGSTEEQLPLIILKTNEKSQFMLYVISYQTHGQIQMIIYHFAITCNDSKKFWVS